jgi:hypothetical protein
MQNVTKATNPTPGIALIEAQGRDPDDVGRDIQDAREAARAARASHDLDSIDPRRSDLKSTLMSVREASRSRQLLQPGSPNPDPDAPCPIP